MVLDHAYVLAQILFFFRYSPFFWLIIPFAFLRFISCSYLLAFDQFLVRLICVLDHLLFGGCSFMDMEISFGTIFPFTFYFAWDPCSHPTRKLTIKNSHQNHPSVLRFWLWSGQTDVRSDFCLQILLISFLFLFNKKILF